MRRSLWRASRLNNNDFNAVPSLNGHELTALPGLTAYMYVRLPLQIPSMDTNVYDHPPSTLRPARTSLYGAFQHDNPPPPSSTLSTYCFDIAPTSRLHPHVLTFHLPGPNTFPPIQPPTHLDRKLVRLIPSPSLTFDFPSHLPLSALWSHCHPVGPPWIKPCILFHQSSLRRPLAFSAQGMQNLHFTSTD